MFLYSFVLFFFFFNDTSTTEIYTLSLHDALPISPRPADFKEVQDRVRSDLQQEKAFEAARVKAAEVKARAASAGLEKAATAQGLVRKETPGLVSRGQAMGDLGSSVALDEAAYALPDQTLSDPIRVPGGWAVIRV